MINTQVFKVIYFPCSKKFYLDHFCRAFVPISQKLWLQQNLEMFLIHFPRLFWKMR